jgi:spermidine/putrescine transport system permease protein
MTGGRGMTGRRGLALLLPATIALTILFVLPQVLMFEVSLGRRSAHGGVVHEWSAANYARAAEPLYAHIFGRSVALAVATTVVCLLAGYPMAYWLARRTDRRFRGALLVLVILPFWTSFLVRMYAWMFILRRDGVLNAALAAIGLPGLDLLYTDGGVLLGQVYGELPFMILPLYVALERLDGALLDAAADLGASPFAVFRRVILPLSAPGALAGSLLVFVPSLGAYLAPDLLGGARTAYIGTLVQSQFAVARDIPFGAALSFVLVACVAASLVLGRRPPARPPAGSP